MLQQFTALKTRKQFRN